MYHCKYTTQKGFQKFKPSCLDSNISQSGGRKLLFVLAKFFTLFYLILTNILLLRARSFAFWRQRLVLQNAPAFVTSCFSNMSKETCL